MIKCSDLINNFLNEYVDGALEETQRVAFDKHISDCVGCIAFLNTYKKTGNLFKERQKLQKRMPTELSHKLLLFLNQKIPHEK